MNDIKEAKKDEKIYYELKYKPRKQQIEALNFLKSVILSGKKYCLLNLPTGSGKSYLAIMFANWYKNNINENAKFDIITNSKLLQKQYISEFSFIKNFEGRNNYFCEKFNTDCLIGYELCKSLNCKCDNCPYEKAKKSWIVSDISLTNFHLFNTIKVYNDFIDSSRKSNVLIIDEAHDFEDVFCDFISISLSTRVFEKYGFTFEEIEKYKKELFNIKKLDVLIKFIDEYFINDVRKQYEHLSKLILSSNDKLKKEYSVYINYCETQLLKLNYLVKEYNKNPENWILDITESDNNKKNDIVFEIKLVWGYDYIKEKIFNKYDHVIFMSATILNKEIFSKITGIEVDQAEYLSLNSMFPVENRTVYFINVGKMTYEKKKVTFTNQIKYIDKILKRHKNKKGIIHCGTYEISEWLQSQYKNDRLIYHSSNNREEILYQHINSTEPSVIVSPSMVEGVDLKDNLSRFQIILKIPYPFLGSNKIKQRKNTIPEWYSWKTVCDLIQMSGRSIRSDDDWAETFILDSSFIDLIKHNGKLIPSWYLDSIKILKV